MLTVIYNSELALVYIVDGKAGAFSQKVDYSQ
jgi:hypothetical protein